MTAVEAPTRDELLARAREMDGWDEFVDWAWSRPLYVDRLADRVRWLGSVSRKNMPNLYRECDAFVLPSRGESFGIVFIEALAHGKPLIATRCGGPEDIVHADNGLLVPMDSVEELAIAMERMIQTSGNYSPQALRADFLARFSASAVVDTIEDWYVALMNSGQHKAEICR